jgi:ketosteroid isomerase-like protein
MVMRRKNLLSICLLSVVLLMASAAFSQTPAEYKAKIEKLNKDMAKNMMESNTEKNLSLYTADAISLPSYEPMLEGIAEIRKASEAMAKSGWKCNSFEATTVKVIPNGNLITEIGTYKISMTMPGMEKPMDDHGKYLTIWEKQKDGDLKVKIDTWNSDVNPMSMMQMDQAGMEQKK